MPKITTWHNGQRNNRKVQKQEKWKDGLKINNPKIPKFYISLKSHKSNDTQRPVVSWIECCTSEISKFLYHHPAHSKTNSFIYKRYKSFHQ